MDSTSWSSTERWWKRRIGWLPTAWDRAWWRKICREGVSRSMGIRNGSKISWRENQWRLASPLLLCKINSSTPTICIITNLPLLPKMTTSRRNLWWAPECQKIQPIISTILSLLLSGLLFINMNSITESSLYRISTMSSQLPRTKENSLRRMELIHSSFLQKSKRIGGTRTLEAIQPERVKSQTILIVHGAWTLLRLNTHRSWTRTTSKLALKFSAVIEKHPKGCLHLALKTFSILKMSIFLRMLVVTDQYLRKTVWLQLT